MLQTPLPFLLHMDSTESNNHHFHIRGAMPVPVLEDSDNESSVSTKFPSFFFFFFLAHALRFVVIREWPVIFLFGPLRYIASSFHIFPGNSGLSKYSTRPKRPACVAKEFDNSKRSGKRTVEWKGRAFWSRVEPTVSADFSVFGGSVVLCVCVWKMFLFFCWFPPRDLKIKTKNKFINAAEISTNCAVISANSDKGRNIITTASSISPLF